MIIAKQQDGHWTAWQEEYPCLSLGGDTAAAAVTRLCEAVEIDPATLAPRYTTVTRDRMEFIEASGLLGARNEANQRVQRKLRDRARGRRYSGKTQTPQENRSSNCRGSGFVQQAKRQRDVARDISC
jgi:hypothetical protein